MFDLADKTLNKSFETMIKGVANNNPAPMPCTVVGTYSGDNNHVDVKTSEGIINYIECICGHTKGAKGVIVFLNGDANSPLAIIDH